MGEPSPPGEWPPHSFATLRRRPPPALATNRCINATPLNSGQINKQWTNKDGFHELKTGDCRVVPISKDLKSLLMELKTNQSSDSLQSSLPMNGKDSGEFVLPRLMEWTHGDQARVLREFCESIRISSIKFHDLRATFITNMLAQGVPLVKVMAIVGHKKMETTDIYLRLAGVDIKGATEALGYAVPHEVDQSNVISINFTGRK